VFGVVQQMRGAHYMSHTLWTAWICWTVTFAIDAAVRFARRPAVRIAAKEAA
jgi:membrane-associated PAP2 superfamily phosphatase